MDIHDGPVVIGYDGGPGAADALRLGIGWADELDSPAIVVLVYGTRPISPGRVDAEWVADRRAEAEHLLGEARRLAATNEVELRARSALDRPPTDYMMWRKSWKPRSSS